MYNGLLDGYVMPLAISLEGVSISGIEKLRRMEEIAKLIESLHHEKQIIHGDVKLSNFLLCSDAKIRLCDFLSDGHLGGDAVCDFRFGPTPADKPRMLGLLGASKTYRGRELTLGMGRFWIASAVCRICSAKGMIAMRMLITPQRC